MCVCRVVWGGVLMKPAGTDICVPSMWETGCVWGRGGKD